MSLIIVINKNSSGIGNNDDDDNNNINNNINNADNKKIIKHDYKFEKVNTSLSSQIAHYNNRIKGSLKWSESFKHCIVQPRPGRGCVLFDLKS